MSSIPEATASSTMYCNVGLSTIGSISLHTDFVMGKKRVPNPAAGMTAFLTFFIVKFLNSAVAAKLYSLFRSEQPVAGIAQPGNDIRMVIEFFIHCRNENIDVRMSFLQGFQPLRGRNEAAEFDMFAAAVF